MLIDKAFYPQTQIEKKGDTVDQYPPNFQF